MATSSYDPARGRSDRITAGRAPWARMIELLHCGEKIRDLLLECGFRRVTVYWQGWDKDGEPDGNFKPATKAEAEKTSTAASSRLTRVKYIFIQVKFWLVKYVLARVNKPSERGLLPSIVANAFFWGVYD